MAEYFYLRFYHKGQFVKDKYLCGKCTKIPSAVDVDTFSFAVLMEYVKDDMKYTEIGGIYVKKQGGGWKLVCSDADVGEILQGILEGCHLDFYIDTVVDKAIEPVKQMQPHVIIRPRRGVIQGDDQEKRQYTTLHKLHNVIKHKKKGADGDLELRATEKLPTEKLESVGQIDHDKVKKQKTKEASKMDELTELEEKRKKRIAENHRMMEELRIKKLRADLKAQKPKNKKVVVDGNISDLEFDRDYVSGHDSLPSSEDEQPPKRTKKVPAVKVATRQPITRSKTIKNVAEISTQAVDEVPIPPPPPPLPSGLQEFNQIKKAYNNDGIGTMEAFLKLKHKVSQKEVENADVHDVEGNQGPTDDNTIDTVPTGGQTKTIRRRGPTKMSHVFTRRMEDRPVMTLNHEFQPVHENSKIRAELGSFLGTLGRECVPMDYINWSHVPEREKNGWWEFVKTKYIIPEEGKDWVLKSICDDWRMHKSRFKARYYTKYETDEQRLQNRPKSIPLEKFKILLQYWSDEKVQSNAKKNSDNRRRVTDTHTAGRTPFAQIADHKKKKLKIPDTPTKGQIYPDTRKGHEKDTKVGEDGQILEEVPKTTEINFDSHGPNWLVGRSGRTRKTRKNLTQSRKSADLEKVREEIAAEMEEKMNQKLKVILRKLAKRNPWLEIDVEELCTTELNEQQSDNDGNDDASMDDRDLDD